MRKIFIVLFLLFVAVPVCQASKPLGPTWREAPGLAGLFQQKSAEGTFILYDPQKRLFIVYNKERSLTPFLPASTFKIANTLIGLDCQAVSSVDETLPYGGQPQPVKAWERDMSLREAIKISNVPVYQELARRIGLERMAAGLRKLSYGNMDPGQSVDTFWLRGPLKISAVQQTLFLARLGKRELPVSSKIQQSVAGITLLDKGPDWELHGKTGWSVGSAPNIGWWVGWIKKEGKIYSFALNIDIANPEDIERREAIGRECLAALGLLPHIP